MGNNRKGGISLGQMIAMIMGGGAEGLGLGEGDDCICRRCQPKTPAEWKQQQIDETQLCQKAAELKLTILNEPPREDGKELMGVSLFSLRLGEDNIFQTISTYGTVGEDDYLIVHQDLRDGKQPKTYNVHGQGAVHHTIDSIQAALNAEGEAFLAAQKAAQPDADEVGKPADAPLQ